VVKRKAARENRYAVALIIGATAIAALVLYLRFGGVGRGLDEDLCLQSGATGSGIVILDVTDQLSDVQRFDTTTKVKAWVQQLPANTLVRIVTVASRNEAGWEEPGLCKSEVLDNPFISNPTKEQERAIRFNKWLNERLTGALNRGDSSESPILETVQWAGLTVANKNLEVGSTNRFLLVSDLIQNTPSLSFINELPDASTFIKSSASVKLQAPLEQAEFEILALTREGFPTPKDLALWWEQWLRRCGAQVTRVVRIVG
jgi:hypothetical protein